MPICPDIAIIGGGAAGALLAVQLARRARAPLSVLLFDAEGAFGRGVAYGKAAPEHLLNVRAELMGAFDDQPDDFYQWLFAHEAEWRKAHPTLEGRALSRDGFMPRLLYGDYIASLLENACALGNAKIEKIRAEVTGAAFAEDSVTLSLADGTERRARTIALAIGNLPIARRKNEAELQRSGRYAGPIWETGENTILTRDRFDASDEPVIIIGTGLTMIDALVSLRRKGYGGKIIAVSGHGALPQPHQIGLPAYPRFLPPCSAPRTALGLLRAFRRELAKAGSANWRGVVDALRADTPALWAQLPERERRKLLRVLSVWNAHRHRMPPESFLRIEEEIAAGTLHIVSGRVRKIDVSGNRLAVHLDTQAEPLAAAHVLNCSGPETNIARAGNALLGNLLAQGIIQRGSLGLGLAVDAGYAARGNAKDRVFVIGPQLLGERLETVAMPEIRRQAEALAKRLLGLKS